MAAQACMLTRQQSSTCRMFEMQCTQGRARIAANKCKMITCLLTIVLHCLVLQEERHLLGTD